MGLVALISSSLLFFLAFRQSQQKQTRFALFLIILGGLVLRYFVAADPFLHEWDERYHALVAKNMVDTPLKPTLYKNPVLPYNYKHWTSNHVWVHKQPLPLWVMASSFKAFGVYLWSLRLPSVILSTLAIWLTFYIGRFYLNAKLALLAAFLHAIHGLIIELTGGRVATDHYDVFFLFFIELGIFFTICYVQSHQKRVLYSVLIGCAIAAAILTKWLPALIAFPIWFCLSIHHRVPWIQIIRDTSIALLVVIGLALPWQYHVFTHFPLEANWEYLYNVKHLSSALEEHGEPWYYHLNKIRMSYGELIYFALLWYLIRTFTFGKRLNYKRVSLICWIFIPIIFFSLAKTKMQAYTLFIAPALFLVTALFWRTLRLNRRLLIKHSNKLAFFVFSLLLVGLPIRYSLERIKPLAKVSMPAWVREVEKIRFEIKESNAILFNTNRPIESLFHSDLVAAYPFLPEKEAIITLKKKGYKLYAYDEAQKIVPLTDAVWIRLYQDR